MPDPENPSTPEFTSKTPQHITPDRAGAIKAEFQPGELGSAALSLRAHLKREKRDGKEEKFDCTVLPDTASFSALMGCLAERHRQDPSTPLVQEMVIMKKLAHGHACAAHLVCHEGEQYLLMIDTLEAKNCQEVKEMTQSVRESFPDMPVFLLSSNLQKGVGCTVFASDAAAHLAKDTRISQQLLAQFSQGDAQTEGLFHVDETCMPPYVMRTAGQSAEKMQAYVQHYKEGGLDILALPLTEGSSSTIANSMPTAVRHHRRTQDVTPFTADFGGAKWMQELETHLSTNPAFLQGYKEVAKDDVSFQEFAHDWMRSNFRNTKLTQKLDGWREEAADYLDAGVSREEFNGMMQRAFGLVEAKEAFSSEFTAPLFPIRVEAVEGEEGKYRVTFDTEQASATSLFLKHHHVPEFNSYRIATDELEKGTAWVGSPTEKFGLEVEATGVENANYRQTLRVFSRSEEGQVQLDNTISGPSTVSFTGTAEQLHAYFAHLQEMTLDHPYPALKEGMVTPLPLAHAAFSGARELARVSGVEHQKPEDITVDKLMAQLVERFVHADDQEQTKARLSDVLKDLYLSNSEHESEPDFTTMKATELTHDQWRIAIEAPHVLKLQIAEVQKFMDEKLPANEEKKPSVRRKLFAENVEKGVEEQRPTR